MRVIIVGAGAMGTLFGTTLIGGGHNVIFLDQWQPLIYSKHKDPNAIIKTEDSTKTIPVQIFALNECPETNADLVIIFVKSASTAKCVNVLEKNNVISENTVVLTCQGGFDNPAIIASHMKNTALLLDGCTTAFCKSFGQMMIENSSIGKTTVWPYQLTKDQEPLPRVSEIVDLCSKSGLIMELTPQAITDRWKMLLSYPTNNAVSAVAGLTYGDVWGTEEGRNLLFELAKEVAVVAKLEGIDEDLFNEQVAIAAVTDTAQEKAEFPGTMLTDYKSKRVTEIDATAGALLRRAKQHNVELPYMKTVWALMRLKEENYGNEYE